MTNARIRALGAITIYDKRHSLPVSGLALMMEALDRAEARDGITEQSIHDEFNEPLARQIIRAIAKGRAS